MDDADHPREAGPHHHSREQPGGRLHGPDAGWRNMLRNLAARAAIADAEAYAHGERRLTVHHDLPAGDDVDELGAVVDVAVGAVPDPPTRFTSEGRFTRWTFRSPDARQQVTAAREAIERAYPGRWRIEADEH